MSVPIEPFEAPAPEIFEIKTRAAGPAGKLPLTEEMLRDRPSGDLFGLTQNAGMGWTPAEVAGKQFLILSTQGGLRAPDGKPIALGYHTGHWEIGLLAQAAAEEFRRLKTIPFAGFCSDPCDGRTQGTPGMFDSLPYRNDAAVVLRRLARSLPVRAGVLGIATCDKGLPAMMMALAGLRDLASVLVPGGVTLPPESGEDAGAVQTLGTRFAHGLVTLVGGCRPRLPRLRFSGRRLPIPRHRRHLPSGRRSAWIILAAFRARPVRSTGLAGSGARLRPSAPSTRKPRHRGA